MLLLFLVTTILSCKKDLTGHWHAEIKNSTHKNDYAIDIEKNNDCYLTMMLGEVPTRGKHHPKENKLFFPGECGSADFNYKLIGNVLYLENALGVKLTAKKVNCNRIQDFKSDLKIDFLKLKKLTKDSVYNNNLNEYINIGYSKQNDILMFEAFGAYGELKTLYNLDSLPYKIEESHAIAEIPFINYILTPDKNIKVNDFNTIIKKLTKSGKNKIYIRTLKDRFSTKNRDIFEHTSIKKGRFDFNSEKL